MTPLRMCGHALVGMLLSNVGWINFNPNLRVRSYDRLTMASLWAQKCPGVPISQNRCLSKDGLPDE